MIKKFRGLHWFAGVVAASLTALAVVTPGAQAATFANPEIRLVSPIIDENNSWDGQMLANQWIGNGWFHEGLTFRQSWAPVGSKIHLVYYVTDLATGQPLANQAVTLRVNKGYSFSNAIVLVNGQGPTNAVEKYNGTDQLRVSATTDAYGYVSFTLQDTLNAELAGEPQPESFTNRGADYDLDSGGDPMISYYTQLLPEIKGEKADASDMIEFHFYRPNSEDQYDLSSTTSRLLSPAMTETSSINRPDVETELSVTNNYYAPGFKFFQRYAATGSRMNIVYNVRDAQGQLVRNREVSLSVGKAFSQSNAKVTNGTVATNLNAAQDADQAIWTDTTDAFGNVLFKATNTDTSGIAKPNSILDPVPATGSKYSQFWLNVSGSQSQIGDMFEIHFFTAPKVAQAIPTVIKSVKRLKTFTVPAKSNRGVTITWTSTTAKVCKKVAANKFKALAVGTCKLTGKNSGNATSLPLSFSKTVKVTK